MTNEVPKVARKILLSFLREDLAEEVLGDLEEKFNSTTKKKSLLRARINYWYQVLNYVRPFAIRKSRPYYSNHYEMLQSYFKIGWRNLLRSKGYSVINIAGLAAGMAVAMLNGLWVWDELSFNQYHKNYDRIGQVVKGSTDDGEYGVGTTMTYPLGTELKTNYGTYFKHIVRTAFPRDYILSNDDSKISATGQFADPEIAEMLTLKMGYGSWSGLKDPHSILLSARTARALFGEADPLDKIIALNNKTNLRVTGIYEDLPLNTSFHATGFFVPWELFLLTNPWIEERALTDWRNHFITLALQNSRGDQGYGNGISLSVRYAYPVLH